MSRIDSSRWTRRLAPVLIGVVAIAGCNDLLFHDPAPAESGIVLSFDIATPAPAPAGLAADAQYDQVNIQLLQGEDVVGQETVSFTPTDSEARVQFTIDLEEPTGTYLVLVQLLEGGQVIGSGSAAVQVERGSVTPVAVDIDESGRVILLPEQREGQTRIVLTWDVNPRDLDSHLLGPDVEGGVFHVYYSNPGSLDQPPYAVLDTDDTSSFGPETITIDRQLEGTYCYYVYNFSGSPDITASEGQVKVYQDNALVASYDVPTNETGTGRFWSVFELNGEAIESINTIATSAPTCQ